MLSPRECGIEPSGSIAHGVSNPPCGAQYSTVIMRLVNQAHVVLETNDEINWFAVMHEIENIPVI